MGALRAEGGVVPVPGVEPRVVRQLGEHPGLQVVQERGEVLRGPGLAGTAGEHRHLLAVNTGRGLDEHRRSAVAPNLAIFDQQPSPPMVLTCTECDHTYEPTTEDFAAGALPGQRILPI